MITTNRNKISEATEKEIPEILELLEKNIADCIYMYIDIKKYGFNNKEMTLWIKRGHNNQIEIVMMRYYESIQIYTKSQKLDLECFDEIFSMNKIKMVLGNADIIKQIYKKNLEKYNYDEEEIYRIESYRKFSETEFIEHALVKDAEEIAKLICSDSVFANNYEEENLTKQLKERMESGMGRNLVIRQGGKIIAHIATYAEYENIAVTSGLVVHHDYRKSGYGFMIESYLVNELLQEGKDIYTFILEMKRSNVLKAMGAKLCGQYGKLTKL